MITVENETMAARVEVKIERRILHLIALLKLMKFPEARWTLKCVRDGYKEMFPRKTGVKPYKFTIPKRERNAQNKVDSLLHEIIDLINDWQNIEDGESMDGSGFFYQAPEYWDGDPLGGEA